MLGAEPQIVNSVTEDLSVHTLRSGSRIANLRVIVVCFSGGIFFLRSYKTTKE